MSSLNSQLHRVGCSKTANIETPHHYALKCPLYSAPQNKLLKAVRALSNQTHQVDINAVI